MIRILFTLSDALLSLDVNVYRATWISVLNMRISMYTITIDIAPHKLKPAFIVRFGI